LDSERHALDNDRTEVHSGQQDYIGGLTVKESGQIMTLTMTLDGAPAVDVLLLPESAGASTISDYTTSPGPSVPVQVALDDVLVSGQPFQRQIPVVPGTYFLLLDHTPQVGRTTPPNVALDARPARVDYLIQVGAR
jgi:hypothetical protein